MRGFWREVVFAIGENEYRWSDAALMGVVVGAWPAVCDRARRGLALYDAADAADDVPLADDEIEAAANEFRYARDLVTADETSSWLGRWELDVDSWMTWVTANLLLQRQETAEDVPAFEEDPETLADAVFSEAVCSGALSRMAQTLAARVAISRRLAEDGDGADAGPGDAPPSIDAGGLALVERLDLGLESEEVLARLSGLGRLDRLFERFCASVARPEDVEARVRARQADWMRIRCRILHLPGEDVAREARLSIEEDGTAMDEVASDSGGELGEGTYFMEELDPALRDHVMAARKGELIGPLRNGDAFALVLVEDKILATIEDEEIRSRASASLVESVVGREVDNRVTWRWGK